MKYSKRFLLAALVIMFTSGHPVALGAHPYHVSLTEIAWNAKTKNFEVAVCVWPEDLEKALGLQEQKQIDLDSTANLNQILASYVARTFTCQIDDQHPAALRWVGFETNNKQAWLYFELRPGKLFEQEKTWKLRNRMLFELNPDQQNQVNFSIEKRLSTGVCSTGNPELDLQFDSNLRMPELGTADTDR